jgi:hypothetical protein
MDAGASAVQRPGRKVRSRSAAVGEAITFTLAVGAVATLAAAAASMLVDSVVLKRILWFLVAGIIAVTAGLWRAGAAPTASPRDPDPLPRGSQTGSPR